MAISAEDKNFLVSLYVGYFNRAPDPAGLQFWIDQVEAGRDTNTIAADFAASPEAKSLYPFLTTPDVSSPTSFITAVYANLFNRAPDAAGQAFWEAQLSSGAVSPADAIDAIIKGATTAPDATILANKNIVGLDFATDAGNTPGFTFDLDGASGSAAKDAISGVTEDSATVTAAQAATDAYLSGIASPGQTFTLTTGTDNLPGTTGDDVFIGAFTSAIETTTVTLGDNLVGGAGNDVFRILVTSDSFESDGVVTTSGIETVVIVDNDGLDLNGSGFSGVKTWGVEGGDNSSTYIGDNGDGEEIMEAFTTVSGKNVGQGSDKYFELEVDNSVFSGTDDRLEVVAEKAGSSEDNDYFEVYIENADGDDDIVEGYDIVSKGTNANGNYVYLSGTAGTTEITVSGATNVEVDINGDDVLARVDASAATGDVMFGTNLNDLEVDFEYVGAQGADDLTVGDGSGGDIDITVNTGMGNDRVGIQSGDLGAGDSLDGGDGVDTLALDVDDFADVEDGTIATANFENVEFNGAAGAATTVDVDAYDAVELATNVSSAFDVTIEGTNGKTVTLSENTQGNTLTFASTGGTDSLTLAFTDDASGTLNDLIVADVETVAVTTSTEDDDLTFTTIDISGVENLSFTGEGDIDIDGLTDDGSLELLDLSGLEGLFDNDGFELNASVAEVLIGNLGSGSIIELDNGTKNVFKFGSLFDNDVTIDVGATDTAGTGEGFDTGVGGDILDLSALGVANFAALTVTQNGADTDITSSAFDGTISLVGVTAGDLDGAANFAFA